MENHPEYVALGRRLEQTFLTMEKDALLRVSHPRKFRLWTYEQCANLFGTVEDWKCGGQVRNLLTGWESRIWLLEEYRLWWRADMEGHDGILVTADPRTGIEWARAMVADRVHRDGLGLSRMARMAEMLQATFKDHFRKIAKCANKLRSAAEAMKKLGAGEILRLLGIKGACSDDDDE